jgi:TolB protein
MFRDLLSRRSHRLMLTAALIVATITSGGAATMAASHAATAKPAATSATATAVLASGQVGTRAQVPWSTVGPGWELVRYTAGTLTKPGTTTLYLVSPAGGMYVMYTWPASVPGGPGLLAWSGDKTRALLMLQTPNNLQQLNLVTGKLTGFRLAGGGQAIAYTRPTGQNILGFQLVGNSVRLARFSLTGQLLKVLGTGAYPYYANAMYSPDGTMLAVSDPRGLVLVSNAGGVIRHLPVPGVAASGCAPIRWWNSTTMLATCDAKGAMASRAWLVPVNGARPAALTPQRTASADRGDFDAWQLPSGLYLQAYGPNGTTQIFRQAANGSITQVTVPQTTGNNNWIVTVSGERMLVAARTGGQSSQGSSMSLLWYNPRTHAEQFLLRTPSTQLGVETVVPYYTTQNAIFY